MAIESRTLRGNTDRRLYTWGASAAVVLVFAGFACTYYLKGAFGAPPLTWLVHSHGLVMTAWFALFALQARLVATRRVALHRKLGIAGGALAGLMVGLGVTTAVVAAKLGHSPGPPPLIFLTIPLFDIVIFGALIAIGLWQRKRREVHRRLMLLASLSILPAAIARLPIESVAKGGPLVFFGLTDLLIVVVVAYDTVRQRRLHPAFGWGALAVIVSHPLRLMLAGTGAWMRFATWITGLVG